MDENTKLFEEFPPVPTNAWEQKIVADLKGADYEKKLIWKTDEGFSVRPYYRAEDLDKLQYLDSVPGEVPFVRGVKINGNKWIIRQDIRNENIADANRIAREAIARGAESVGLNATKVSSANDMASLLNGIDLLKTGINFISSVSYPRTLGYLLEYLSSSGIDAGKVRGSLNFDPLGYLLLNGEFFKSPEDNFNDASFLVNTAAKHLDNFRIINVNGCIFAGAGSNLVQELAFSLAAANEYLCQLTERGIQIDEIAPRIQVTLSSGSNYFPEIAKLRAARLLWSAIVGQYKPERNESMKLFIHTVTSSWNKTVFDPYVNMLRTTTESMSAIIGNTDSLTVLPFDASFREADDFSARIARNQQLILREEAYLDKVADPAAGSYFIENLTDSIASHAWDLFKKIEEKGGFTECVKNGFIQDEVEASALKKSADVAQRKTVMIGTNQYPNLNEKMIGEISKSLFPADDDKPSAYRKLKLFRGSQGFEKLRLTTEEMVAKGRKRPDVFLLTIGNLAMRKARATFATNFFGCAGFAVTDNAGFSSPAEGAEAALKAQPDFVVICSSDEEYPVVVPEAVKAIKSGNPGIKVIVAGFPKEIIDDLKAAGVDDFIHIRSNLLETLKKYQSEL